MASQSGLRTTSGARRRDGGRDLRLGGLLSAAIVHVRRQRPGAIRLHPARRHHCQFPPGPGRRAHLAGARLRNCIVRRSRCRPDRSALAGGAVGLQRRTGAPATGRFAVRLLPRRCSHLGGGGDGAVGLAARRRSAGVAGGVLPRHGPEHGRRREGARCRGPRRATPLGGGRVRVRRTRRAGQAVVRRRHRGVEVGPTRPARIRVGHPPASARREPPSRRTSPRCLWVGLPRHCTDTGVASVAPSPAGPPRRARRGAPAVHPVRYRHAPGPCRCRRHAPARDGPTCCR